MDVRGLLSTLDDDQRRAATSTATPLAVIAPAGSGKTRVLTARVLHRIDNGTADAAHVLCVTFTRKAAAELRGRFSSLGLRDPIETGTFHSIALRQLRDRWASSGRTPPTVLDRAKPFLAEHLSASAAELTELSAEIGWARARLVSPVGYAEAAAAAGRRTRRPSEWIGEQYAAYEQAKSRAHVLDFDDLLAACTAAIHGDPAFAAAQRWRFRHLFVDEFQDVNPLQFALLEAWRGDQWDAFVVGDPHQSIYGWNGADPGLLQTLDRRWPALETVHLDRTHRSTPQITAAAASVVTTAGLPDRHPESTGADGPPPRIHEHRDELDEIAVIAGLLRRRSRSNSWSDMAVMARTQSQVAELERGLQIYGIPTRVRRNAGMLDDSLVQRTLRALSRDDRPLPIALATALPPDDHDPDDSLVAAIVRAAETFSSFEPAPVGRSFANWARGSLSEIEAGPRDAVSLSTMHAAKGLEWPIVHIAMCENGFMPHGSARRKAARDEEARLLYVAMTRAERELEVHWARSRTIAGRRRDREPSPFLERLDETVAAVPQPVLSTGHGQLESLRRRLPQRPPIDPLLAALRAWRTARSRAARTVPESVLSDATLRVIAERRPTTMDQLRDVPGMGTARLTRYGPELLDLVARSVAPLRARP